MRANRVRAFECVWRFGAHVGPRARPPTGAGGEKRGSVVQRTVRGPRRAVFADEKECTIKVKKCQKEEAAQVHEEVPEELQEGRHTTDLNRCTGIQLLYLAGNKYNPNVEITNSDVFKKERACKQYFRAPEVKAHLIGRGFERINLDRIIDDLKLI